MPGFDGRGPEGMGAMTGGGRGFCALPAGQFPAGSMGRGYGGRGGGRGRGFRNRFISTGLPGWRRADISLNADGRVVDEAAMLKQEASYLKEQMDQIQERIDLLEAGRQKTDDRKQI